MARHPNLPSETPCPVADAIGSAACPDSRCVNLVWRDPETGEMLTLGLEASPALIECLRADGFRIDVDEPGGGRPDGNAGGGADGDPEGNPDGNADGFAAA